MLTGRDPEVCPALIIWSETFSVSLCGNSLNLLCLLFSRSVLSLIESLHKIKKSLLKQSSGKNSASTEIAETEKN